MSTEMNPTTILHNLWQKTFEFDDWDPLRGNHILELDPETFMTLRKIDIYWWGANCEYRDGEWYYRGYFKIKIIHEKLPNSRPIDDPEVINLKTDKFRHFSIHIERNNGRMRYIDYEGNTTYEQEST